MKYKDLAKHFTENFEEYKTILQEHIEFNDEILNHVFFGECNDYFIELIGKEKEIQKIKELFAFFEQMATQGDDDVKELLSVAILARLGDSKKLLQAAYKYMGDETRKASDEIEKYWGRY
ncbi:hypothetical protein E2K98_29800 [Bacillus salipaludis]|uniref:DUF7674 domain-containing protein n=1 Tax=Bacillus salipaludis TaxID=2547811 RepID=A0A4R5VHI9_9BACI|nr:hypothetical protein [Bacillus salipaludis]MDQ6596397.1 hypothetical protein [Bacillus salipaludis]TDK54067.1 hypothetical protein E2K98_29800 [Bacillus salipaludis]